jgi:hypothetical protein
VPLLNQPDELKPKQQEGCTIMRTKALTNAFAVVAVLMAASPAFARHEMREHVCDPRVESCRAPSFDSCFLGQNCGPRRPATDTNSNAWPNDLFLD